MSLHVSEGNSDDEWSWYCARTQPKHEHIAAANVAKRLGFEVFHPRLRMERTTRRGVVSLIEPLFPCYIFVRCPGRQDLEQIRYVHGISSLVNFGGLVPTIPDETVEELRQCFGWDELVAVGERLEPGMEVSLVEGAFLGSRGIVVRVLPARQRVHILLDFLGRTTLTEVDRKTVRVENQTLADLVPSLAAMQCPVSGAAA